MTIVVSLFIKNNKEKSVYCDYDGKVFVAKGTAGVVASVRGDQELLPCQREVSSSQLQNRPRAKVKSISNYGGTYVKKMRR